MNVEELAQVAGHWGSQAAHMLDAPKPVVQIIVFVQYGRRNAHFSSVGLCRLHMTHGFLLMTKERIVITSSLRHHPQRRNKPAAPHVLSIQDPRNSAACAGSQEERRCCKGKTGSCEHSRQEPACLSKTELLSSFRKSLIHETAENAIVTIDYQLDGKGWLRRRSSS
jgi:hypothetical protein